MGIHSFRQAIVTKGLILVAAALMAVSLAGCAQDFLVSEPLAIKFIHREDDSAYYETMLTRYQKEVPDIQVQLVIKSWRELYEPASLDADCFAIPASALGQLQTEADPPTLSLDELIQQDDSFNLPDFFPGAVGLARARSKTWAIPAGLSPYVMFYNKDLFSRAQAAFPQLGWNWDDFLNAALAVRDAQANIWGYAPNPQIDPLLFIYQHGGGIFDNLQDPTRTTFDDPRTVEALEWYAGLFHTHNVAPARREDLGSGGTYREAMYRAVFSSQVAMWSGAFQERGGLWSWRGNLWPFQWGVLPFPRDAQAATYAEVEVFAISPRTKHPQACWSWIVFLSRQISSNARLAPARRSLVESAEYKRLVGEELASVVQAALENAIIPPSSEQFTQFQGELEAFGRAMEMITAGQLTPQEALEWVQTQGK